MVTVTTYSDYYGKGSPEILKMFINQNAVSCKRIH